MSRDVEKNVKIASEWLAAKDKLRAAHEELRLARESAERHFNAIVKLGRPLIVVIRPEKAVLIMCLSKDGGLCFEEIDAS